MTDMPDFDSMSPEDMMKWMESLAKRQGATEGLTTSADMDVAEVSADDSRLAGKGDYVPYGWTEDKWKEHLAKEEAEKKAKQAVAPPPQPVKAAPPPPPPPQPAPEPVAQAASADAMPDFDSMSPEDLMKWMESLAKRQGATEGLTTSADMQVAEVSADDSRLAGKGDYVPYGWTEDKWKEHLAKEEAQKKAKQAAAPAQPVQAAPPPRQPEPEPQPDEDLEIALAGNVLEAPSLDDLFSGSNVIEEDEEETALDMPSFDDFFGGAADNAMPDLDLSALEGLGASGNAADDPLSWLAGLGGSEEESVPDIDLDALSGLSNLGAVEPVAESSPMDWLAGLADDSDMLDEADGDSQEGSLEWLESLARREGADSEELVTNADLDIPMPDNFLDDGPGYEDFSFEQGSGMIADDEEDAELVPSFDLDSMDMDDPENWLDQLAQSQSGTASVGFGDEDDDMGEEIPHFDDVRDDIQAKINSGNVSPEEIALLFGTAFDLAKKRDVPDYIDSDDDEDIDVVEAPVQAEIPDWLQETLSSVPDAEAVDTPSPRKGDTAEMMLQNLGLESEAVDELPDWLNTDAGEDTGDITVDIFDIPSQAPTHKTSEIGTEEVAVIDNSDSWVQAFQQEASGELEEWYEGKIAEIEGGDIAQLIPQPVAKTQPEPIAAVSAEGLQVANLPLETALEHGEAMLVPAWLGGEQPIITASQMGSVEAATVGEMDWLSDDATDAVDVDMPDWLKEQVDDTVAPAEELPSWLAGDDIDIESVEEIPDWLRETMGEEEEALVDFSVEEEPVAPQPEPIVVPVAKPPTAITAAPKSPAPVPKVAAAIDVSAAFQAAEQKVGFGDIDGAMLDYESIVRSNQALEQVEKALDKLTKADATKRNPAVFRVLGDVRMRQGKLQEALDTYRRALNML